MDIDKLTPIYLGDIAEVRHVWVPLGEHGTRECVYLAERHGLPAKRLPCDGRSLDAAEH